MIGKITPLRWGILLVLFLVTAPAMTLAIHTAGLGWVGSGLIVLVASAVVGLLLAGILPRDLGSNRRSLRILLSGWILLSVFAAFRIASLGVFMHDVERTELAFQPTVRLFDDPEMAKPFFPQHNCFTCYVVAAHLAGERVANLYDTRFYRRAEAQDRTPIHEQVGDALHIDTYQYPPPFLLLPRVLQVIGGDFYQLRTYWFAINVLVFTALVVTLARWIEPARFRAIWWTLPLMFLSPIMAGTLQIQNVHLFMIAISMLALPAFETRRHALGGALLGFAIVSKLFPGLLLVFLLLRRRWRAAVWTVAWMIAYCLATLILFGPEPFEAFLTYQAPRLANGEAFWFATEFVNALVKNGSVMGIAYKLEKLGVLSNAAPVARALVLAHTGLIAALLLFVARGRARGSTPRTDDDTPASARLGLARLWLVLMIVGQLRSPFLPWVYGNIPILLLLILLLPSRPKLDVTPWKTMLLVPAMVIVGVVVPLPFGPPTITLDLVHTLVALAIALISCAIIVFRSRNAFSGGARSGEQVGAHPLVV